LVVDTLLQKRNIQLAKEEKESGTKQPDTELTDCIDAWQEHLNDIGKVEDMKSQSKDE
jgi:hypothetical protein